MKAQLRKLEAHASHLLTAFIHLRERYALLDPMLFVPHVPKQYGSYRQQRGFAILRSSLFLSCCQDIAKLSTDHFKNTPSIDKFMTCLDDGTLRLRLRKVWCDAQHSVAEDDDDPALANVYRSMAIADNVQHGLEFDEHCADAISLWQDFSESAILKSFREVRDSVSAHSEVKFVEEQYQFVDVAELGIKWKDIRSTINTMQQLVEKIGLIFRCTGFAWESLDEQLREAGSDFWIDSPSRAREIHSTGHS